MAAYQSEEESSYWDDEHAGVREVVWRCEDAVKTMKADMSAEMKARFEIGLHLEMVSVSPPIVRRSSEMGQRHFYLILDEELMQQLAQDNAASILRCPPILGMIQTQIDYGISPMFGSIGRSVCFNSVIKARHLVPDVKRDTAGFDLSPLSLWWLWPEEGDEISGERLPLWWREPMRCKLSICSGMVHGTDKM